MTAPELDTGFASSLTRSTAAALSRARVPTDPGAREGHPACSSGADTVFRRTGGAAQQPTADS